MCTVYGYCIHCSFLFFFSVKQSNLHEHLPEVVSIQGVPSTQDSTQGMPSTQQAQGVPIAPGLPSTQGIHLNQAVPLAPGLPSNQGIPLNQEVPLAQGVPSTQVLEKLHHILVHFDCSGIKRFPLRLSSGNFDEFYSKILSTFKNELPDFEDSYCVEYQCGNEWYDFTIDTGYSHLCMDDTNPQIKVRTKSIATTPGMLYVVLQIVYMLYLYHKLECFA